MQVLHKLNLESDVRYRSSHIREEPTFYFLLFLVVGGWWLVVGRGASSLDL